MAAPQLTLRFRNPGTTLRSLATGSVIAAGITRATPGGMLRRVTAVHRRGNVLVVSTVPASLSQAIKSGSFTATASVSRATIRSYSALRGVHLQARGQGPADDACFTVDDVTLAQDSSTGAKIAANGNLCFSLDFRLAVSKPLFGPFHSEFSSTLKESSHIQMKVGYSASIDGDKAKIRIAQFPGPTIATAIGLLPIVITSQIEVYVGAEGEVSLGIVTGASQSLTDTAGVSCDDAQCHPTGGPPKPDGGYDPVTPAAASAKAYLNPGLVVFIDGLALPRLDAKGYLEFDADASQTPWWSLYIGFQVYLDYKLKVLDLVDFEWTHTFVDWKKLLLQASEPSSPSPTATSPPTPTASPPPTSVPPTPVPTTPSQSVPQRCGGPAYAATTLATPTFNCYAIWTDKGTYQVGDTITYCYVVPYPVHVRIVDHTPDGNSQVILDGNDDGTGQCAHARITPPLGQECLELDLFVNGQTYSDQVCWQVVNSQQPPPQKCGFTVYAATTLVAAPSNCYFIWTDKDTYQVGDTITYCYVVPYPVHVRLIDHTPDGRSQTILDGNDDGTGQCSHATITPPTGQECLELDLFVNGQTYSDQVCWQVVQPQQPPPQQCGMGPYANTAAIVAPSDCYAIWTDQNTYQVGQTIRYCYVVPYPVHVRLIDHTPDGNSQVILDGNDDGTGQCSSATITPPTGQECLELDLLVNGQTYSAQTCWQVVGSAMELRARSAPHWQRMTRWEARQAQA